MVCRQLTSKQYTTISQKLVIKYLKDRLGSNGYERNYYNTRMNALDVVEVIVYAHHIFVHP